MVLYVRDLEQAKHGHGGIPDRQKLTEARKDLDKVLTVRPCLRTHLEMAQVNTQTTNEHCGCNFYSYRVFRCMSFLPLGVLLHGCRRTPGESFGG